MTHASLRSAVALASLAVASSAFAQTAAPSVKLTIEFGRAEAGKPITPSRYELIVPMNGSTEITGGLRLPVPNGWASPAGPPKSDTPSAVVAYNFTNVGVSARLNVYPKAQGRLQITGTITASLLKGWRSGNPDVPLIGTIYESVDVTVEPGKRTRFIDATEPELGNLYLELSASPIE